MVWLLNETSGYDIRFLLTFKRNGNKMSDIDQNISLIEINSYRR